MTDPSERLWEQIDRDVESGRLIFKRETSFGSGGYGGHFFELSADFEVRDAEGVVLFRTSGSASGEYWCGTFLWFVKGSGGRRVRLYQSDRDEDVFYNLPNGAVAPPSLSDAGP